jgi:glycosyltransferase involved in cell wall biosynthesis
MSAVLHTMRLWLPLSEQFVHTLVTRSRYRAIVVSRDPLENETVFPHRPVYSLGRRIRRHDPPTVTERRLLTAAYAAVALAHRTRVVHHHHGYRLPDVVGVARRLRLPLVVSVHGHDVTAFASTWPGSIRDALPQADAVIIPSRFLTDAVLALGVTTERIHVLPSGVDTNFFAPTPLPVQDREALFVGRFVEKKGLDVLLAAWRDVRDRIPDARLVLLGYGPLEALARSGGPGVIVEPADPSRRAEQVRDAIRRARVVVTPSRTATDGDVETLLLVNLEAQASARPVVTTRHGGIPEFVDEGRTALLVPENDPAALADALAGVLSDDALATQLAEAGPSWARRFDWNTAVAAVDDLYDTLTR